MNNHQIKTYRQLLNSLGFYKVHEAQLADNPLALQMFADLGPLNSEISELLAQQDRNGKALTEQKQVTVNTLIDMSVNCYDLLFSYGNYKDFAVFTNIKGCKKSDLKRSRDEDVIIHANKLKTIMEAYPNETLASGVTAEKQTALDTAITAAQDVIDIPQEFRKKQHEITLVLNEKLETFKKILNGSLKGNMSSFYAESNPQLHTAFVQAIDIDALPKQKRPLKGRITDENGQPVRRVRISVDGKKPLIKGGENGGYHFNSFPAGKHVLTFSRKSFKTVTKTILIVPDHSLQLDIVMPFVEIEESLEA